MCIDDEDDACDDVLGQEKEPEDPELFAGITATSNSDAFAKKVERGNPEALKQLEEITADIEAELSAARDTMLAAMSAEEDSDAAMELIKMIADATHLQQLFPLMVQFLREAEKELPHGLRPHAKTKGIHHMNDARAVLRVARDAFMHQKAGRTSCLAGWEMSSKTLPTQDSTSLQIDYVESFSTNGYRFPEVFWPMFFSSASARKPGDPMEEPQVITVNGAVLVVCCLFVRAGGDKKTKLAWTQHQAKRASALIAAEPVRSQELMFFYGPTSKLRRILLKKTTKVVELFCGSIKHDNESLRVELTPQAHLAACKLAEQAASAELEKADKQLEKQAAVKLGENLIAQAPIRFIEGFVFNEHAFLNKPTSTVGMAQARSGMQFVTTRRAHILSHSEEEATLKSEWLQVTPIYFENEFLKKGKTKKLEDYSRFAYAKLAECIDEFTKKKEDYKYRVILKGLKEIASKHK